MNIKKIITFSNLRDQGISSLDIQNDEVIQMKSKDKMLCIIDQSYLLELEKIKQEYHNVTHRPFGSNGLVSSSISSLFQKNQEQKMLSNGLSIENRVTKLEKEFEAFLKKKEK